jgi:arabinofuranan 3-O-arabinosyltransferase
VMTQFSGIFLYMMPSTFGTLRLIGSDANLALMLHGAVAGLALVLAALVLSRCRDAGLRGAVLILMTLVVTPYWLSYDYGMAAGAIALAYKGNPGVTRGERRRRSLLLLSSLAPIAVIPPPQLAIPLAPLLVLIGCATVLATAAKIQGNAADNDPRSVT